MAFIPNSAQAKSLICTLAVLAGFHLLAPPVMAQSSGDRKEQSEPSEARLERLIEGLEIGMSALEELNRRDALEIVQRITNELRQDRERGRARKPQGDNEEIRTVRRRLKVMRTAVDAFLEAERRQAAELVERAMHARELSIEGRRDEEANRIREAAPNRGQLAELLGGAARLHREWGHPDRAEALAELSKTYAKQWRRQQEAQGEHRRSENQSEGGSGLDSLATRIEIIRYARDAFAEVDNERNAKALEKAIHYGELALEGVTGERLNEAAAAVPSMGNLIEQLNWASRQYREWNRGERAAACKNLAEFYARQRRPEGRPEEAGGIEDLNRRIEILGLALAGLKRAGNEDRAHRMGRFLHVAELQRDGAEREAIAQAADGLTIDMTIELLKKASSLYKEWGAKERAQACKQLAEYYARRAGSEAEHTEQDRPDRERAERVDQERNFEERAQRLDVLRLARAAHAEANHPDAKDILERAIRVGELQMKGASAEKIAKATEGLSMEMIVELTQGAAKLYQQWNHRDRAAACTSLAEFYLRRDEQNR
jgi:hypothetical protein